MNFGSSLFSFCEEESDDEIKQAVTDESNIEIDLGELNPKQVDFFKATTKYTLFGGAKGGGKSHVTDRLAIYYAVTYPGINMLLLRATFEDVRKNHIEPILKLLPPSVHSYNGSTHQITFWNGSTIQFGNWSGLESERKYQGQSYDIVFIDEASQFTERMFHHLCGCLRGNVGKGFPKRIYLTANPGRFCRFA